FGHSGHGGCFTTCRGSTGSRITARPITARPTVASDFLSPFHLLSEMARDPGRSSQSSGPRATCGGGKSDRQLIQARRYCRCRHAQKRCPVPAVLSSPKGQAIVEPLGENLLQRLIPALLGRD